MSVDQIQLPVGPPARIRALDDYGQVGEGFSMARSVSAENGQEYIVKCADFVPVHPCVAANEYIAGRLAQQLGLPILDFAVLDFFGIPVFAGAWMAQGTFHLRTTHELYARCENLDRVYDLVVFDAWINNTDRHEGNLLVREVRPRGSDQTRLTLLLNDHSHCLVRPELTSISLGAWLLAPPAKFVHLPYVRESITEAALLSAALQRVAQVPDDVVDAVFAEMPAEFLPSPHDGRLIRDYLLERRDALIDIFTEHRAFFPSLDGGPL